MNKTIFSLLCFLSLTVSTATAQLPQITLQHAGGVKLFDSSQMTQALAEAVDGDTLSLSEGGFTGGFTIDKAVTVVGSGQTSIINGNVAIGIPGTKTLTARTLDALKITGDITNKLAVVGLNIRKCNFENISFAGDADKVTVDRCRCYDTFTLSASVKDILVTNSKIWILKGYGATLNATKIMNCNIYKICGNYSEPTYYEGTFKGTVINSIVNGSTGSYSYVGPSAIFVNCLLNNYYNYLTRYSTQQNCMYSNNSVLDNKMECPSDADVMLNNGWLGNDGTVVGIYGGNTPFTLEPAVPKVERYTLTVDNEAKVLRASLKVSAN